MNQALLALLGFGAWTALLGFTVVMWRTMLVFAGKKAANEFPSGQQHGGDLYWRINRAHVNSAENLPIMGAAVLIGQFVGAVDAAFETVALVYLGARLAQSVAHISSGTSIAVTIRASFLILQFGCFAVLAWMIVT